jgi:hypothetical protein
MEYAYVDIPMSNSLYEDLLLNVDVAVGAEESANVLFIQEELRGYGRCLRRDRGQVARDLTLTHGHQLVHRISSTLIPAGIARVC